tara:strand:- start:3993 stop:4181 length:189 start_codon:yes stop_codon:yes gene_type:complete
LELKFKSVPCAKGMTMAKKIKKVAGAIICMKKPEREAVFEYSNGVMTETNVFFPPKRKTIQL